jgi:hypothetical protein
MSQKTVEVVATVVVADAPDGEATGELIVEAVHEALLGHFTDRVSSVRVRLANPS